MGFLENQINTYMEMQNANYEKEEKWSCFGWGRSEGPDNGPTLLFQETIL